MLVNSSLIQKLQGEYWFFYVRGWPQLVAHGRTIESESSTIAGVPESIYQGWGVGWKQGGASEERFKSKFVAVLVSMLSMLSMLVQVRRGGGEGGLVLINASTLFLVLRHSITRLSFLLSYNVLFMMIGTMNHLPWPSEWMRMRKIYPVVLGKKINCSLFQFYLNLYVALWRKPPKMLLVPVTVRWKCSSTNYFSSHSRGVLVSPTVVNKLWEKGLN